MMLVDKMAETRRALRDASKQVIVALNRMHEVEEQVNNLARVLGNNNRKHAAAHQPVVKVKKNSSKLDVKIVPAYDTDENWSADVSTTAHRKGHTNSGRTKRTSGNAGKVRKLLANHTNATTAMARDLGVKNPSVYFNNEVTAGRAKHVGVGTYRAI